MEEWEKYIRDNPLAFGKLIFAEYAKAAFDREYAADRMQDLVKSALSQTEPEHEENVRTIKEAHAFIARAKAGVSASGAAGPLKKGSYGKTHSHPPDKLTAWRYAQSLGLAQAVFEDWWELGEKTDWTASDGKIRSWHATLKGYAKWREKQDNPPQPKEVQND